MKIWNDEVDSCVKCKMWNYSIDVCNYTKEHLPAKINKQSYKLDFDCRTEIHLDCPFNKSIEDLVAIEHYRYSHLKETHLSDTKLAQIKKYKNGNNLYEIEVFEKKDNLTWITKQLIENITINNPEALKFILNRLGI